MYPDQAGMSVGAAGTVVQGRFWTRVCEDHQGKWAVVVGVSERSFRMRNISKVKHPALTDVILGSLYCVSQTVNDERTQHRDVYGTGDKG